MKKFILLFAGSLFFSALSIAMPQQESLLLPEEANKDGKKLFIHENFNEPVFPPPGYQSIGLVDTARWNLKLAGSSPQALPQDGTYLISYNSLSEEAGDAAALITPLITIPSAGYRVRISMYRDGSYPTATDRIEVLVNSKAMVNGATSLGVVHRSIALSPVISAEGWYYYDFPISLTGEVYFIFKAISGFGANLHMDAFFVEQIPPGVPSLGVIPPSLDFGAVPVGYDGESESIRLWNIGEGNLVIGQGGIALTGTDAGAYTLGTISYPIELSKYESFDIDIGFLPATATVHNAQLEITHNGENTPTTVNISGEGYEPLAYFSENFDGVVAPFLPPTWEKVIQSTAGNAFVGTYVLADPYSLPNHVQLYNGADVAAQLMLVSPAASGFDENWLGFSVKTFSSNQILKIGTIADPRHPETFVEIKRITLPTNTYNRYYISLQEYAGTNKYIVFLHGLGGSYRAIYLDDVVWEPMPPDPVFSVSPSEKDFGDVMVGSSAPQAFTIANTSGGILTIHPENIVLEGLHASDFVLTSLAGTVNLSLGQTATFTVAFAPQSAGDKTATISIEDNLGVKVLHQVALNGRAYAGTVTAFPWTETFEDSSPSRPAWTQVKVAGNASWTYNTGSNGGLITTAHEGSKNARFVSVSGTNSPITRLITPWLDLTGMTNPSLIFFLGQQAWSGDQNQTKIYYRTSASSAWVQLTHYTESISSWTRKMLGLPNPSATYQLAFEGINNYGWANVLDLVTVCPELLPVSVSISASQTEVCQATPVTFFASPVNGGSDPAYQWKVNGQNAGTNSPEFTHIPANGDQVWVELTSNETCSENNVATSTSITLTVNPSLPVSVSITASQTEVCQGTSMTFTAIPVNGGSNPTYQWKKNGSNVGTGGPTFTYTPVHGDQVWVVMTSNEPCTTGSPASSYSITMTVNPLLPVSVSINASLLEVCQGTSVTFTAAPVNGGTSPTYQWKKNGANVGTGSSTYTYPPANGDQVWVVMTSSATCTSGNPASSNTIEMTVYVNPTVTWDWQPEPLNLWDDPITLSGGLPTGGNYSGNGVSEGIFYPSDAGPGLHTLIYTYTSIHGCQGSATASLEVLEAPDCNPPTNLSAENITINSGMLTWIAGNIEAEWQLEWGLSGFVQGTGTLVSGLSTPTYALSNLQEETTYEFFVRAVCGGGATSTWAGPHSFTTLFTMICPEDLSECEVSEAFPLSGGIPSGGIYSGNGVADGMFYPSVAGPGTHNITYTYKGETCYFSIIVEPAMPVSVSISVDQTEVCQGSVVTYTANPANGGSNPFYQWMVNGIETGFNSPVFTYAPYQGDEVIVIMTSGLECTTGNPANSNSIWITVNPMLPVSVSVSASQTEVCAGTAVTFTASPVNGGSSPTYQWKKNGSNVGTGGPTFTYTPVHGDQVWVEMASSEPCTTGSPASSNSITMTVNPLLPVSVSITVSQQEVCQGTQVVFVANPVNGGSEPSYQWKVNGMNVGYDNQTFSYSPEDLDQVTLVMTSSLACATGNPATSNTITMTVNPLLPVSVSITASASVVSEGTEVTYTAHPINEGSNPVYQWKVNGVTAGGNNPVLSYVPVHGDQVWVVMTSSATCATGNPATSNVIVMTVFGPNGFQINLRLALEGPFSPGSGGILMETFLASGNHVPLSQPFGPPLPYNGNSHPVWYYTGEETVGSLPEGVVDWVLIELRDAPSAEQATSSTMVAQQPAFLLNTGEVAGLHSPLPSFDLSVQHQLFVVVYHRNHLAVMSSGPLQPVQGVYAWDFTLDSKKAFSVMDKSAYQDGQKLLGAGIYGLFGGDGDGNGQVQTQDKNGVWNTQSGLSGYLPGDFDMNGQVQTQDKNEIWNPNSGMASQVPAGIKNSNTDQP